MNTATKLMTERVYRALHCFSEDSEAVAPPVAFISSINATPTGVDVVILNAEAESPAMSPTVLITFSCDHHRRLLGHDQPKRILLGILTQWRWGSARWYLEHRTVKIPIQWVD